MANEKPKTATTEIWGTEIPYASTVSMARRAFKDKGSDSITCTSYAAKLLDCGNNGSSVAEGRINNETPFDRVMMTEARRRLAT